MNEVVNTCKMCGHCCHYEIPITILDIHRVARYLGVTDRQAFEECVQPQVSPRSSLFMIRKNENGACIFLNPENKCSVHNAKPKGCGFFVCNRNSKLSGETAIPWTANYSEPSKRSELWEQSIACVFTKAYIRNNDAAWNEKDYFNALSGIQDNVVVNDKQKIKLSRNKNGDPLAMIYDCSQCQQRGMLSCETLVTLDDIKRITRQKGITWDAFFQDYIDIRASARTGVLKLKRGQHCVFYNEGHCTIEKVRPMHCRFTPCPQRTTSEEMMDCLYLGSGTVEEQFRHQLALMITREYVNECGTRYDKHIARRLLEEIDNLIHDQVKLEEFCRIIGSYRYVDDTLLILNQKKCKGHINEPSL